MTHRPTTRLGTLASALIGRVARRGRRLPAREAYALWADSYPPWAHNPLMYAEQQAVAPIIASTSPRRALDVGTGSGRYLPVLAATGAQVIVGVDFSLPMLIGASGKAACLPSRQATRGASPSNHDRAALPSRFAERGRPPDGLAIGQSIRAAGVARVCGDARCLPFGDASFDLVSASLMVGDVADLAGWMGEMARVLAPGGQLIYSDFHPRWASAGWRRTFQATDGRSIEVPYFSHTVAEHVKRLEQCRFAVRLIREQPLAAEHAAGASGKDAPIVVVFHAVKRLPPLHAAAPPTVSARRG